MMKAIFVLLLACIFPNWASPSYPISAAWFKDRSDIEDIQKAMQEFKSIGGDTVIQIGSDLLNVTSDDLKSHPVFAECMVGEDHCVDVLMNNLSQRGITVKHWMIWTGSHNITNGATYCPDDKIITTSQYKFVQFVFNYRIGADDCIYKNITDTVGVVYSVYDFLKPEPLSDLITVITDPQHEMDLYIGLPEPPQIVDCSDESKDIMKLSYKFGGRIIYANGKLYSTVTNIKGYYSGRSVNPADLGVSSDPVARLTILYWSWILVTIRWAHQDLIATMTTDMRRSGGHQLAEILTGVESLRSSLLDSFILVINDGQGTGTSAYFTHFESNETISSVNPTLWNILHEQNNTLEKNITFNDVYYNSTQQLIGQLNNVNDVNWVMIEAWDKLNSTSYFDAAQGQQSANITQLTRAIASSGAQVQRISAYAWDPYFHCKKPDQTTLLDQIKSEVHEPIISECRFHSPQNISIVLIGYNMAGPYGSYEVTYPTIDYGTKKVSLYVYYVELDYGEQHHLDKSLQYVMLYDIPDVLFELSHVGTITIKTSNLSTPMCKFSYDIRHANDLLSQP